MVSAGVIALLLLLLCMQAFLSLRMYPSAHSSPFHDGGTTSLADFVTQVSHTTLRPLDAAEQELTWRTRLRPVAVPAVRFVANATSMFQLVSRWEVAATEAETGAELVAVHWATVDHDDCPDLFAVTSALMPAPAASAASNASSELALVTVSCLMSYACGQNGTNSSHAAAVSHAVRLNEGDATFLAGLSVHMATKAGSALSTLAVDADNNYYADLVLAAEMPQLGDGGSVTVLGSGSNSSVENTSIACKPARSESQVSRLLLPRGSVLVREMALAPEAILDAAADSAADAAAYGPTEAAASRSVAVGLPITAIDWNLDGMLDYLHAHTDGETLHYRSLTALPSPDASCIGDCTELFTQRDVFQPVAPNSFPCTVLLLALVDADLLPEAVCVGSAFPRKLRILHYSHHQKALQDWTWRMRPLPVPSEETPLPRTRHSLFDACMVELNGDGYVDYVLATHRQGLVVWLSSPELAPIPPPKPPAKLSTMMVPGYVVHFVTPPWAEHLRGGKRSDAHSALSVACADLDNDKDLDVVVLYERSEEKGEEGDEQRASAIFLNDANTGRMQYAGSLSGGASSGTQGEAERAMPRGAALAIADYNADGRMDVLAASSTGFQLYRNQGLTMSSTGEFVKHQYWRQHWLTVSLWGVEVSNAFAVGAVVHVIGNSGRLKLTQIVQAPSAATRPHAQHGTVLHFGLGNCSLLEYLIVHWPRARQGHARNLLRYESIAVDQHLHILQLNTGELGVPANLQSSLVGYHFRQGRCARSGWQRLRPSFFIVGQFKGGTSSLAASLLSHPRVKPASMKELHYFSHLVEHMPLEWYAQHFPCGTATDVTYDASASYFGSRRAAAAIRATFPRAKLILLLRDPVTRAFSHFRMMFVRHGDLQPAASGVAEVPVDDFYEAASLEIALFRACVARRSPAYNGTAEALSSEMMAAGEVVPFSALDDCYSDEDNVSTFYVRAGLYEVMLRWWTALGSGGAHNASQLLVVASEQFRDEPAAVLRRVHSFVGIEPLDEGQYKKENAGAAGNISDAAQAMLRDFYRPFNQRLARHITFSDGKTPSWIDYSEHAPSS